MTVEEIAEKFLRPDYMAGGIWFNYKQGDEYKRALSAIQWQSTQTAAEIAMLREAEYCNKCTINNLQQERGELTTKLAERDERIKELEACLKELWPLSTNAFGELSVDEVNADPILYQLSKAIDNAKALLHPNHLK